MAPAKKPTKKAVKKTAKKRTPRKGGTPQLREALMASRPRLRDSDLDPEHFIMEGVDAPTPIFTVSEVTKMFFGKSGSWLRSLDKGGKFVLNGESVGTRRAAKEHGFRREYNLVDIEHVAHALAQGNIIGADQLRKTLHVVRAVARLHGYKVR